MIWLGAYASTFRRSCLIDRRRSVGLRVRPAIEAGLMLSAEAASLYRRQFPVLLRSQGFDRVYRCRTARRKITGEDRARRQDQGYSNVTDGIQRTDVKQQRLHELHERGR